MANFDESTLDSLYQSVVQAFPRTKMRQHAVDPIEVEEFTWIPYLGLKTLYVKAEVRNETRHHLPMILFKGVKYGQGIKLTANDGKVYQLEQLAMDKNDVLVRCDCGDYKWRLNYYNHVDKSLYGPKRKKYEALGVRPPANPTESPGLCKHLMKMAAILRETGILA